MTRAGAKASGVFVAAFMILGLVELAQAQEGAVSAGYVGLPIKAASGDTGLLVGQGARLHAGVGTEFGYDSNVFFQPSGGLSSALLRVVPFADLNNQLTAAGSGGAATFATAVSYDLSANLQYRHLFSDNSQIDTSGIRDTFSPSVSGFLDFSQAQHLGFSVSDAFARTEDAPYVPGQTAILRYANQASAQIRWSPGGGRLQGILRYNNRLDLLEGDYRADRTITNEGLLDVSWRWLPKTALFVSVEQGAIRYLDDSQSNRDSNPLRVRAGIRGLVTEKVSAGLSAGFSDGFYRDNVNPSGIDQLGGHADISYRPTQLTSMSLGYQHDFQNSIIGHYYNVDLVHLALRHSIADRLIASAFGHYEYRRFDSPAQTDPLNLAATGGPSRTDNYFSAGAAADYYVLAWAYGGVGYNLFRNSSNATFADTTGQQVSASYLKQQVFVRVGVTY
jgi:hypothetical protein